MAVAHVADTTFARTTSATTTTGVVSATPGNSLLLLFGSAVGGTGTFTAVTDTGGNTWTLPDPPKGGLSGGTNSFIACAYVHNCVSPGTITVTHNSTTTQVIVIEFSGALNAAPDLAVEDFTNAANTTDVRSAAGTPSAIGEFIVGFANHGGTATTGVSAGWSALPTPPASTNIHLDSAYKINAALASEQCLFTGQVTAGRTSGGLLSFLAAAPAGTSETPPPGGAVAQGQAPTSRATGTAGGAVAQARTPGPAATPGIGASLASGSTPTPKATAAAGGAVAGSSAPTSVAPVTAGGAVAGGSAPGPSTTAGAGAALAAGLAPQPSTTATPIVGSALAGGPAPGASASASAGGSLAGGLAAAPHATVSAGGAAGAGSAPAVRVAVVPGGAAAGGVAPSVPSDAVNGGALAGGVAPGATAISGVGGTQAGTRAPAPSASVDRGTAVAAGLTPLLTTALAVAGDALATGLGPMAAAPVDAGAALAGGVVPSAPTPDVVPRGGAQAGGFGPSAVARAPAPTARAGAVVAGAEVRELRSGTKTLVRVTLPQGAPEIGAWIDGLGSGSGDATVRGLLYDLSGSLVATGQEVVVEHGSPVSRRTLPFDSFVTWAGGDAIVAVHAGGPDRSARIYGGALATPTVNLVANPVLANNATGWARWVGSSTGARDAADGVAAGEASWVDTKTVAEAFTGGSYNGWQTTGETFSVAVWVKFSIAGTYKVEANNGPSSLVKNEDAGFRAYAANTWTRVPISNITWAAGWQVRIVARTQAGTFPIGHTFKVSRLTIAFSTTAPPDVHAGLPGCLTDGVAHASTSRGPQGTVNYAGNPNGVVGGTGYGIWGGSGHVAAFTYSFADGPAGGPATCVRILDTTPAANASCIVAHGGGDPASGNLTPVQMETRGYAQVVPGGKFGVGAWVKAAANAPSGTWKIPFYWRASNGDWLGVATTTNTGIPIVAGQWTWVSAVSTVPAGAYWATSWVGQDDATKVPTSVTIDIRVTGYTHGPMAAAPVAPIYGGAALCDQLASPNASPSIQWLVPEVSDLYTDGPAATTGLTPASAHLPSTTLQVVVRSLNGSAESLAGGVGPVAAAMVGGGGTLAGALAPLPLVVVDLLRGGALAGGLPPHIGVVLFPEAVERGALSAVLVATATGVRVTTQGGATMAEEPTTVSIPRQGTTVQVVR